MNNYIILDGYWYTAPFPEFNPEGPTKPARLRKTLAGATDVTYGPAVTEAWQGSIWAPVSASGSYGTIANLRTTIAKMQAVTYTDHYGVNQGTVHILGPFRQRPQTPVWDSSLNKWKVTLRLVKA